MISFLLVASWVLVALLAVTMLVAVRKLKTAFTYKGWTLAPTWEVGKITAALAAAQDELARLRGATFEARDASQGVREEFAILGRELDARTQEVRELRMGQAFVAQRPFMAASVRAIEAIKCDRDPTSDPIKTLQGIEVDLTELLEDHGVEVVTPAVGDRLPARGVDPGAARHVPTGDAAKVGTLASVDRPAYIAVGPDPEVVLKPAVVSIYVDEGTTR